MNFLLPADVARVTVGNRLRMLDLKVNFKKKYEYNRNCPFCTAELEHLDHIFVLLAFMHQNQVLLLIIIVYQTKYG